MTCTQTAQQPPPIEVVALATNLFLFFSFIKLLQIERGFTNNIISGEIDARSSPDRFSSTFVPFLIKQPSSRRTERVWFNTKHSSGFFGAIHATITLRVDFQAGRLWRPDAATELKRVVGMETGRRERERQKKTHKHHTRTHRNTHDSWVEKKRTRFSKANRLLVISFFQSKKIMKEKKKRLEGRGRSLDFVILSFWNRRGDYKSSTARWKLVIWKF